MEHTHTHTQSVTTVWQIGCTCLTLPYTHNTTTQERAHTLPLMFSGIISQLFQIATYGNSFLGTDHFKDM